MHMCTTETSSNCVLPFDFTTNEKKKKVCTKQSETPDQLELWHFWSLLHATQCNRANRRISIAFVFFRGHRKNTCDSITFDQAHERRNSICIAIFCRPKICISKTHSFRTPNRDSYLYAKQCTAMAGKVSSICIAIGRSSSNMSLLSLVPVLLRYKIRSDKNSRYRNAAAAHTTKNDNRKLYAREH